MPYFLPYTIRIGPLAVYRYETQTQPRAGVAARREATSAMQFAAITMDNCKFLSYPRERLLHLAQRLLVRATRLRDDQRHAPPDRRALLCVIGNLRHQRAL